MLRLEMIKMIKIIIVILTLTASMAQLAWAKQGQAKGEKQGKAEHSQRVEKASERARVQSPSRQAEMPKREIPRAESRPTGPSMREQATKIPQISQRQEPAPRQETRITRVPSGVEVRRPEKANPKNERQVIIPNNDVKTTDKPGFLSRIELPKERTVKTRDISKPITDKKLQEDRGPLIIKRIDLPKNEKKPIVEQKREVNRVSQITLPGDKPKRPVIDGSIRPRPDEQTRTRDNDSDTSSIRRWFDGRGRNDNTTRTDAVSRNSDLFRSRRDGLTKFDSISRSSDIVRSRRRTIEMEDSHHEFRRFRPANTTRVIYEDRRSGFGSRYHHDFIFRDRHQRICSRIIWPRYYYPVYYSWGHQYSFHYVYPFYHRRYVFISLNGFWPDYSYVRYYWYPTHFYTWYGYTPIAYEVPGNTYNYYTYNYYGQQGVISTTTDYSTSGTGLTPVTAETFADVREKLSREGKSPDAKTLSDTMFEDGVKAFEQANYAEATEKFYAAMQLAPEDQILPFAYAQALFAEGKYTESAEAIRTALLKSSPDKEGVYYPRGLYLDENTLDEQIDQLAKAADAMPGDSDLQMLLGYNLLGVGETDKAVGPLTKARDDYKNFGAANTLLELAEKIKTGETQ